MVNNRNWYRPRQKMMRMMMMMMIVDDKEEDSLSSLLIVNGLKWATRWWLKWWRWWWLFIEISTDNQPKWTSFIRVNLLFIFLFLQHHHHDHHDHHRHHHNYDRLYYHHIFYYNIHCNVKMSFMLSPFFSQCLNLNFSGFLVFFSKILIVFPIVNLIVIQQSTGLTPCCDRSQWAYES